uniref:disintegrin and metalloproteinase domain-containing protein 21-like n=1 Tax=Jaculus jaculus TaxID=51337 RepID=UPI0003333CCD|nr:disintegrin and metalloproteinase domain-containing protein 21-like [Jaculus jaculus]
MTVVETQVHVRILFLPLWLELFLVLSGWPKIGCSQYHSPPEVVIPLRIAGNSRGINAPGWISYSLHFGGQRHTIHMKLKKFSVSRDLSVFTYTDQGAVLEEQPFVQNDCFYHGYVEGEPESMVSLSNCLGSFQGMLKINGIVYEIKPKMFSDAFEHLVYKMDSEEKQSVPMTYGLTGEEIAEQLKFQDNLSSTLMQSSYTGWWLHRWFVELAIIVEHERFLFRNSNISIVEMDVVITVSLVDEHYNSIDVDIVLIAIEVWNTRNPIQSFDARGLMSEFCIWKELSFDSRVPHDTSVIIVKQNWCLPNLSISYYAGICRLLSNCGLVCHVDDGVAQIVALTTHELGHSLGMKDDEPECICKEKLCIMDRNIVFSESFTNCSYASFIETIFKRSCLYNVPNSKRIITKKRCGNGVIEDEEECDCGSIKLCEKNTCCLPNCTLVHGSTCASGLCCEKCQFLPSGTLCRDSINQCDLPEWCDGTSSECPEDVYVEDGLHCLGEGLCFQKRCNNRDLQCRDIFGEGAKSANLTCYQQMNTRGDRFGHCGLENIRYVRCKNADVLCGRVQCENVTQIPRLQNHTTVLSTPISSFNCWSTDYHFGMMNVYDIGEVKDGTECGQDLMCLQKKCVTMPKWQDSCLPNFCNKRGICNNKHHCHCNKDWAPPNCLEEGNGGSVDSGPAPDKHVAYWIYGLLLFGIAVLLLSSCFLIGRLRRNNQMPKQKQEDMQTLPVIQNENVQTSPTKKEKIVERSPVQDVTNVGKPPQLQDKKAETLSVKKSRKPKTDKKVGQSLKKGGVPKSQN